MAKDDPYFRLRIPEGLLKKVQDSAATTNRSATAEILHRLEASFETVGAAPSPEMREYLDSLLRDAVDRIVGARSGMTTEQVEAEVDAIKDEERRRREKMGGSNIGALGPDHPDHRRFTKH